MMSLAIGCVLTIGLKLIVSRPAYSQPSVNVSGNVSVTLNTATAGENPDPVTDSSSMLSWDKDTATEITVMTDLTSPKFTLKVEGVSVSGGSSAGEVTISTTAQKLIDVTDNGSCTLKYTGSTQASAGTGTDIHTITYTIQ
jgi:hypothetical protein